MPTVRRDEVLRSSVTWGWAGRCEEGSKTLGQGVRGSFDHSLFFLRASPMNASCLPPLGSFPARLRNDDRPRAKPLHAIIRPLPTPLFSPLDPLHVFLLVSGTLSRGRLLLLLSPRRSRSMPPGLTAHLSRRHRHVLLTRSLLPRLPREPVVGLHQLFRNEGSLPPPEAVAVARHQGWLRKPSRSCTGHRRLGEAKRLVYRGVAG
mmetsp:Transcript_11809/g.29526  ORF Transcript_11809/g.29526 Transcript_11809/m.29526 type:complete len:205 (+) Transcript_11809:1259-1873(+)